MEETPSVVDQLRSTGTPLDKLLYLKHIVDQQSRIARAGTLPDLQDIITPLQADVWTWRAAIRYAHSRSHALDTELRQMRDRLQEISAWKGDE